MNEAPFTCSTQQQAPGLGHKHQNRMAMFAKDKHSSLLRKSVSYGQRKFYNIGPRSSLETQLAVSPQLSNSLSLVLRHFLIFCVYLLKRPKFLYFSLFFCLYCGQLRHQLCNIFEIVCFSFSSKFFPLQVCSMLPDSTFLQNLVTFSFTSIFRHCTYTS